MRHKHVMFIFHEAGLLKVIIIDTRLLGTVVHCTNDHDLSSPLIMCSISFTTTTLNKAADDVQRHLIGQNVANCSNRLKVGM